MINPAVSSPEWFISAGVKANRVLEFSVRQDGNFWYGLLKDIEDQAEESKHFPDIQRLVLESIEIRSQLKEQGF